MIELQGLTVRFGARFGLSDLSLSVPRGGSLALWGPNGAGKSTTFHAILGLLPYGGRVLIDGQDAARRGPMVRRLIGWAPQELAPAESTVARSVTFLARLRGVRIGPVDAYLERFGLADTTALPVLALSGGQRKRFSLALALLGDPEILLLDEPTANVDPEARRQMVNLLRQLRREGKTLMMASHRIGDVAELSDRVAMLNDGRLLEIKAVPPLLRRRVRSEAGPDWREAHALANGCDHWGT